jgi:hypothetical protein
MPKFKVEHMELITREYVRANRDKVFLFGDNLMQIGYGGQAAAMRGEPNAIGIPTKRRPDSETDAFFSDRHFEHQKWFIDRAFKKLEAWPEGTVVVIPSAGLGTGLAELDQRSPKTFAYLVDQLAVLGFGVSSSAVVNR